VQLKKGDIIEIRTGRGGGWGDPKERDRSLVQKDLKNGVISLDKAQSIYAYQG